ncbi:hypothetical protein PLESTB_000480300 [Pleodorina starrii]|uniref:Uncharacterized protein n=1 Tax=Pleodorina starrii TaxID=330485 RepID=A0A9W6BG76_9CHLO|nr:hypothetical protein PLESTB_000480300 [Pleodorina starrii]GLC63589.1 hypothetical protein PLESTF_000052700 [Pleodorina starrii]
MRAQQQAAAIDRSGLSSRQIPAAVASKPNQESPAFPAIATSVAGDPVMAPTQATAPAERGTARFRSTTPASGEWLVTGRLGG